MAIGTTAAILGAAAIGAGGSILGGKSQSKAATQAANISVQDNAANRQFLEGIYNRNAGYLSPYMQSGLAANNAIMELLGLTPQGGAAPQPSAFGSMGSTPQPSVFGGGEPIMYDRERLPMSDTFLTPQGGAATGFGLSPVESPSTAGLAPVAAPGAPQSARSAFDIYRGSTGYDFRVNEGIRGLQSAFSRNLDSGASTKAALRFGQGIASDEFGRYMDLLRGQAQLGFGAGSALAGVGQNFGQSVVSGNQSAASQAATARLYSGNASANMWAGLGSSFGGALGQIKW